MFIKECVSCFYAYCKIIKIKKKFKLKKNKNKKQKTN